MREFVKGEFKKDVIEDLLKNHAHPEKIWKKAAELGFIGIHYPEKYSGMGTGCLENIIVAEELARGDSTAGKPSYRGLSLILVEADNPNVSYQDVSRKMGIALSYTAEVVFKDVRVAIAGIVKLIPDRMVHLAAS